MPLVCSRSMGFIYPFWSDASGQSEALLLCRCGKYSCPAARWKYASIRHLVAASITVVQNFINRGQQSAPGERLFDQPHARVHRLVLCDQLAGVP